MEVRALSFLSDAAMPSPSSSQRCSECGHYSNTCFEWEERILCFRCYPTTLISEAESRLKRLALEIRERPSNAYEDKTSHEITRIVLTLGNFWEAEVIEAADFLRVKDEGSS